MIRGKIKNKIDMQTVEECIRNYIEKCFKDAFEKEGRKYDKDSWDFDFILIRNKSKNVDWHMIPFIQCEYGRVQGNVMYRLGRNLEKNFGIIHKDDANLRTYLGGSVIDPNNTDMAFRRHGKILTLSIFDEDYNNEDESNTRYEKMIFTYYGIDPEQYRPNIHAAPADMRDWYKYSELYEKTFGVPIGKGYETYCSSGIERL